MGCGLHTLLFAVIVGPGEAPPEDALDNQMIGGSGCADADSEVELPLRPQIEVNRRNELLLLLVEWIEDRDRSVPRVIFQPASDSFGEIIARLHVGGKHYALMNAGAVKRAVERGVETQVPAADFLVHDGADFPGPGVGREGGALVSDFVRQTHPYRPVPRLRNAEAGTDVITHPLPAAIRLNAGEDVKAGLEPVVDALRDFHGLMLGMVGGQDAVDCRLAAFSGEV